LRASTAVDASASNHCLEIRMFSPGAAADSRITAILVPRPLRVKGVRSVQRQMGQPCPQQDFETGGRLAEKHPAWQQYQDADEGYGTLAAFKLTRIFAPKYHAGKANRTRQQNKFSTVSRFTQDV
jgi:hypothetical protein